MLILNDFACSDCGLVSEELLDSKVKAVTCPCGGKAYLTITKSTVVGCDSFNPHYDIQLGQHFESKAQKDKFLKATGREQLSGSPSPRNSTEGRVICNKTQSKAL